MNATDDRMHRSVRAVLGDFVAAAPVGAPRPTPAIVALPRESATRTRPWAVAAAALTAAAGITGVLVLREGGEPGREQAVATQPEFGPLATGPLATGTPTTAPGTTPESAVNSVLAMLPPHMPNQDDSPCGDAVIPGDVTDVRTARADIDGDTIDDHVTLYRIGDEWHVNATSSVKGWASDTTVTLEVDDDAELTFEDVDYSLGAETPPPVAVMVTGSGANELGIMANFTFLTNTPEYCIEQWTYDPPNKPVEPFQWVVRRADGIATGMVCEGAAGSRYYALYDSTPNPDGSWRVVTRLLTHDFTRAEITFEPITAVPDSPEFLDQYADIVGCDHPPVA